MFRAPLRSALPDQPQSVFLNTKVSWFSRLPSVMKPQEEHRIEV
jgi:hypothetical protein